MTKLLSSLILSIALGGTAFAQDAPAAEEDPSAAEEEAPSAEEESAEEGDSAEDEAPSEQTPAEDEDSAEEDADPPDELVEPGATTDPPQGGDPDADPTGAVSADETRADNPWDRVGWGWGGVPAINYNSDNGFGFGVLGSIYRYDGSTDPYKVAFTILLYATTKGIQTHRVDMDMLQVGGLPLRLTTRVEFASSLSDNFCGMGPDDICDPDTPYERADELGYVDDPNDPDDEYDLFVRRYYKVTSTSPNVFVNARYMLSDKPHRFELMGSWWASYNQPGVSFPDFLAVDGPYEDSRYAEYYPEGEQGFASTLQAGVMLDNRDNEPAPHRGYWWEASIRGAHHFWGNKQEWNYFGFNTTMRAYTPLIPSERLILTDRLVLDGVFGDPRVAELARAGGSQIYSFFGGQRAGRGVRARGVLGRARAMNQTELRWTVWSPILAKGKLNLDITPIGFYDVGYWALDWSDIPDGNAGVVWGTGGGLRLAFNKNFIIRADVGTSPREENLGVYIDISNLW